MTRYKVSNKNIYGLRAGMFLTLGVCTPAVMALALIVEFFIAPLFYKGYVKSHTVPGGAAGSARSQISC